MEACSLRIMADQSGNPTYKDDSLSMYVKALAAVRAALGDPQRAVEDVTLVATILLCIFEVRVPSW